MRLLITLDAVSGVWRYAVDLGGWLRDAGHDIAFAGLGPRPDRVQQAEARGIGSLDWSPAPPDWMADHPAKLDGAGRWLAGIVERRAPDVVQANLPIQAALLARRMAAVPPVVAVSHSCHATWMRAVQGRPMPVAMAWHGRMTREGLRLARRAVAPSRAHAAMTAAAYGGRMPAAVANASRAPLGEPSEGDGSVIAAARWWDMGKNGDCLAAAAAALPGRAVTMAGPCRGPGGLRFQCSAARLAGPLPHAEVMALMARASLFVSPSRYEPFGLAALEAARAARPLLLADIAVYRELWQGAARFFDPSDPAALAREIERLLAAPAERLALARAARTRAMTFTREAQGRAMLDIYEEALAAPPGD